MVLITKNTEILIYLVLIFIYLKFMFQIKANLNMRLVAFYHSNDPVVNATSSGFELLFHHIVVHTNLRVTVRGADRMNGHSVRYPRFK